MSAVRRIKGKQKQWDYKGIESINGYHPLKDKVPFSYIEYPVRKRKNGKVLFFNYELAREMGMIAKNHPNEMTSDLNATLLDTFSLIIVNEHDYLNATPIDSKDLKEHRYMATRYLQMQHPNKTGTTSGDGRSMWNGTFSGNGKTWDITSCGTGATCLSPASAQSQTFFKSGDPTISYGCGYAMRDEGITQAVFGEILHRNGVPTERTLAVIEFPQGFAVNVRVGENLLRPSHMFNHLKQGQYDRAKAMVDFYMARQYSNKAWPKCPKNKNPYDHMLEQFCKVFAETAALFESEYIFCWLDWDGDNILANGAIIDYGSIRQFGLFHKDYRFDDGPRFSTSIVEQREKARYTIQTFAQLRDFLVTGEKKPLKSYSKHRILRKFDRQFEASMRLSLLKKAGFEDKQAEMLYSRHRKLVDAFAKSFHHFERTVTDRAPRRVADGVTRDVVFCMRDVLRELPKHLATEESPMDGNTFIEVARSSYANRKDLKLSYSRRRRITEFQRQYRQLVTKAARVSNKSEKVIWAQVVCNTSIINRFERVTGDAMCLVVDRLLKQKARMSTDGFYHLIGDLINSQILDPSKVEGPYSSLEQIDQRHKRIVQNYMRLIKSQREGI